MKNILFTICGIVFICISGTAQDLIYTPKNPAFGGSYFNYSWMLNSAQMQDKLEDPNRTEEVDPFDRDPLRDFEESLNRQILNQLSREIVDNQFGEGSFSEGTYNIGSYQIDVTEGADGLDIVILDIATGNQTSLFVPYY